MTIGGRKTRLFRRVRRLRGFALGAWALDTGVLRKPTADDVLWRLLQKRRLAGYRFVRNHRSGDDVVPFYCQELRFAVDIERTGSLLRQKEEALRDERLNAVGVQVMRIPEEVILRRPESARNTILEELPAPYEAMHSRS